MNQQRVMLSLGVALVCALGCGDDAASPEPHDVAITADAGDASTDVGDMGAADGGDAALAPDADIDAASRPALDDGWASRDASAADTACATVPCPAEPPRSSPLDDCPSGVFEGGEWFEDGRGICAPMPPQGVPLDACPSGMLAAEDQFEGGGVCRPELPRMNASTCPEGWVVETTPPNELWRSASYCRPLLPDAPCEDGYGVPGEPACVPFGACPAGPWLPPGELRSHATGYDGELRYVDPTASGPADGSATAPFPSVSDALASARDGDVIVLAPGIYPDIVVGRDVAFVGACEAQTQVSALLVTSGADVMATRIRFDGPDHYAVRVGVPADDLMGCDGDADASLALRDVSVRGGDADASWIVFPRRGSSTVRVCSGSRVSIVDARLRTDHGTAVVIEPLASAELRRVDLSTGSGSAVSALTGAARIELRDVVTFDNSSTAIMVRPGVAATVERVAIVRANGVGVFVADDGEEQDVASVHLVDVYIDGAPAEGRDRSLTRGIEVELATHLIAERVFVRGCEHEGMVFEDDAGVAGLGLQHHIALSDVVVIDTGEAGLAIDASSVLSIERLFTQSTTDYGLRIAPRAHPDAITSSIDLRDVMIADVILGEEVLIEAMSVSGDLTMNAVRVELASWRDIALNTYRRRYNIDDDQVFLATPVLVVTDFVATSTPAEARRDGFTLYIDTGTTLTLSRAAVRAGARRAIDVRARSTATLTDVVVLGSAIEGSDPIDAVGVLDGATLSGTRMLVERAAYQAFALYAADDAVGPRTSISLTDVDVLDTQVDPVTGTGGFGFRFYPDTNALLRRVRIDGCRSAGMSLGTSSAQTQGISVVARDFVLRNCRADDNGADGGGIFVGPGGSLDLEHALIVDNDYGGIAAFGDDQGEPARATLRDTVVARHNGSDYTGTAGIGLIAGLGGLIEVERVDVIDNRSCGVAAIGEGSAPSAVRGTDLRVLQTRFQRCAVAGEATTPCAPSQAFGSGLLTAFGGALELERVESSSNAFVGLQIVSGGRARITDGLLADNVIGLNVYEAELDINRDFERVVRRGNDIDEEWANVPFPSLADLLDF